MNRVLIQGINKEIFFTFEKFALARSFLLWQAELKKIHFSSSWSFVLTLFALYHNKPFSLLYRPLFETNTNWRVYFPFLTLFCLSSLTFSTASNRLELLVLALWFSLFSEDIRIYCPSLHSTADWDIAMLSYWQSSSLWVFLMITAWPYIFTWAKHQQKGTFFSTNFKAEGRKYLFFA